MTWARRVGTPRWTVAFKYEPDRALTKLLDVKVQVGKLGTLTPVAVLEPVLLAGTTVSRATLHNYEQVERLGVMIGDTVAVEKAGEIIPQVVLVDKDKRPKDAKAIERPTKCPECGGPVSAGEDEAVYIRCMNLECPAQFKERLRSFAGRNQMDIEGLGPARIKQLVDSGLVKEVGDIYRLHEPGRLGQLLQLERAGETSVDNLLKAIEESKGPAAASVAGGPDDPARRRARGGCAGSALWRYRRAHGGQPGGPRRDQRCGCDCGGIGAQVLPFRRRSPHHPGTAGRRGEHG